MDFHATTVKGVPLVSGLEWRALAGTGTVDKELRQVARYLDAKLHVSIQNSDGATMVGFLPNEMRSEMPVNAVSLPMLLAGVPDIAPNCILVIEDDEGATVAALLNGAPAPGFDGYGEREEVLTAAQNFIRVAPHGVTVYGNCESLGAEPLELADIVERSSPAMQKAAKLHGMAMSPLTRVVLLSLVLLAVGGLAKWGYDYKERLRKIAADRLANVNPDVAYANAVTPLFAAEIPVKQAMPELARILRDIPVSEGGWDLAGITCTKDGCAFTWANVAGTNKTFVVPTQVKGLKYSPKGDTVTYEMGYVKPLPLGLQVKYPLTLELLWRDVIGDFQQYAALGVGREFSTPTDFGLPPGILGTPSVVFKEGRYTVSAPWPLRDVVAKLPDASTFDTLAISIDQEKRISFKLSGKYYVQ